MLNTEKKKKREANRFYTKNNTPEKIFHLLTIMVKIKQI